MAGAKAMATSLPTNNGRVYVNVCMYVCMYVCINVNV